MNTGINDSEVQDKLKILEILLEYTPTEVEEEYPTLFDISSYPHYENVISSWYKFFLVEENPHGLGKLFYSSLLELVGLEYSDSGATPCKVEREYPTKGGGRIDLLVYEEKEGKLFRNPIIIENKIYADLPNDLDDYYDSVEAENKIVLVLSLHGHEKIQLKKERSGEEKKKFKVRTHNQYMDKIKKNIPDYIGSVDPKYFIYLQDFINNIERITMPYVITEDMKYYFDNSKKFNTLLKVKKKAYQFLVNVLCESVRDKESNNWSWGRTAATGDYVSFTTDNKDAVFYITLDGDNYEIKVWINKNFQKQWDNMNNDKKDYAKQLIEELNQSGLPKRKADSAESGVLASANYKINIDQLESFGTEVVKIIENKWKPLIEVISNPDAQ